MGADYLHYGKHARCRTMRKGLKEKRTGFSTKQSPPNAYS